MQLIINGRFVENHWKDAESFAHSADEPTLVKYSEQLEIDEVGSRAPEHTGLIVENSLSADALIRFFDRVRLIVIEFPSQMDGRGYSLATTIRRLGYTHELRARGEIIADQYHHLRACSFDSVEITREIAERHTELEWRKAWMRFPLRYQARVSRLSSILDQRHSQLDKSIVN